MLGISTERLRRVSQLAIPIISGLIALTYATYTGYEAEMQSRENAYQKAKAETLFARNSEENAKRIATMLEAMQANQMKLESDLRALVEQSQNHRDHQVDAKPSLSSADMMISKVDQLALTVQSIQKEIESYKIALGDDPAKKLAVAILRKDLDDLSQAQKDEVATVKDQLSAAREDAKGNFDTIKWILGLVGLSNIVAPLLSRFGKSAATTE